MAPRSDMQVHTQGVFPSKPRTFLTDLGSLELFYRAKGMEEVCGGGSAFPCEGGVPIALPLELQSSDLIWRSSIV